MATTNASLKLLIDTKGQRVLFAEASKDFVDFLFNILTLPVGTILRLLTKQGMVGCLGNLYERIENSSDTYLQPTTNKDILLKPRVLSIENVRHLLVNPLPNKASTSPAANDQGGYVKGDVIYMVMDDLVVSPMSTISSVNILKKFDVKEVGALQKELIINVSMKEAMKLVKASLNSKTVLSDVFLKQKVRKKCSK